MSARNQLAGRIKTVKVGNVMTEVIVQVGDQEVVAAITSGSAKRMKLKVGDRVVPGANVPCGRCYYCANDFPYYFCQDLEDYGNSLNLSRRPGLFGGWSQYMYLLPGTPIFRVPEDIARLRFCVEIAIDRACERLIWVRT